MPKVRAVTAQSSDQEIIDTINAAGEFHHTWRKYDWPKEPTNNWKTWVIPNDIGQSTRKDKTLLNRLRVMVKQGLLEERCDGTRQMPINNFLFATTYVCCNGMPRFRVIRQ